MISNTLPPSGLIAFEDSLTLQNFNTARIQTLGFRAAGDNIVTFGNIQGLSATKKPAGVTC